MESGSAGGIFSPAKRQSVSGLTPEANCLANNEALVFKYIMPIIVQLCVKTGVRRVATNVDCGGGEQGPAQ